MKSKTSCKVERVAVEQHTARRILISSMRQALRPDPRA
jgi:hypothetical protein